MNPRIVALVCALSAFSSQSAFSVSSNENMSLYSTSPDVSDSQATWVSQQEVLKSAHNFDQMLKQFGQKTLRLVSFESAGFIGDSQELADRIHHWHERVSKLSPREAIASYELLASEFNTFEQEFASLLRKFIESPSSRHGFEIGLAWIDVQKSWEIFHYSMTKRFSWEDEKRPH
jgi:hypothetical protein